MITSGSSHDKDASAERHRRGLSDAARRAGDDGDFAVKAEQFHRVLCDPCVWHVTTPCRSSQADCAREASKHLTNFLLFQARKHNMYCKVTAVPTGAANNTCEVGPKACRFARQLGPERRSKPGLACYADPHNQCWA